jgi:hypothetical protein
LAKSVHFRKKINTTDIIYWGNFKYFKEHVAKKKNSNNPFYEKAKMLKKKTHL